MPWWTLRLLPRFGPARICLRAARGATVGFTINFLALAVATDLVATASVRRRGGTLCTGDVSVRNSADEEVATAIVTYKLTGYRHNVQRR